MSKFDLALKLPVIILKIIKNLKHKEKQKDHIIQFIKNQRKNENLVLSNY